MESGLITHGKDSTTVHYVWDYANEVHCTEQEMPVGSERWQASERGKWGQIQQAREDQAREEGNNEER